MPQTCGGRGMGTDHAAGVAGRNRLAGYEAGPLAAAHRLGGPDGDAGAAPVSDLPPEVGCGRQLQVYEGVSGLGGCTTAGSGGHSDAGGLGVGGCRIIIPDGGDVAVGERVSAGAAGGLGAANESPAGQADTDARPASPARYADDQC